MKLEQNKMVHNVVVKAYIHANQILLNAMTEQERVDFWQELQDGYCKHCGTDDPRCPCNNDV